jgi:hypothetical protein
LRIISILPFHAFWWSEWVRAKGEGVLLRLWELGFPEVLGGIFDDCDG